MDDNQPLEDDLDEMFEAQDPNEIDAEQNQPTDKPVDTPEPPAEEPKDEPADADKPVDEPKQDLEPPVEPLKEEPKGITLDDIKTVINEVRDTERDSFKSVQSLKEEILSVYLPDGMPKVVTDEDGNEFHTPQDVIKWAEKQGEEVSYEQAHQWLMNEEYKLQKKAREWEDNAQQLAEVNANFRNGGVRVLEQYGNLFDKKPGLQQKVYKNYMKAVKWDEEKGIILSAPDIEEYYADYLEPYLAVHSEELSQAPAVTPPPVEEPKGPTIEDRMDEDGDGGGPDKVVNKNNPSEALDDLFGNG